MDEQIDEKKKKRVIALCEICKKPCEESKHIHKNKELWENNYEECFKNFVRNNYFILTFANGKEPVRIKYNHDALLKAIAYYGYNYRTNITVKDKNGNWILSSKGFRIRNSSSTYYPMGFIYEHGFRLGLINHVQNGYVPDNVDDCIY